MKKWFLILLAALLLLAAACSTTEEAPSQTPQNGTETPQGGTVPETPGPDETMPPAPEDPEYEPAEDGREPLSESVSGEWFAEYAGAVLTLTLAEDGSYTAAFPGAEAHTGTWEAKDGVVVLDGDENDPLLPVGDVLRLESRGMLFSREKPECYAPANVVSGAKAGSFDGYWKSYYTAAGEGTVLSAAIGEDTELYIEGTTVGVNGALLGLAQYEGTVENGALTFAADRGTVTLELQEDGLLRLTVSGGTPAVLYLMPAAIPGDEPGA